MLLRLILLGNRDYIVLERHFNMDLRVGEMFVVEEVSGAMTLEVDQIVWERGERVAYTLLIDTEPRSTAKELLDAGWTKY